MEKEQEEMTQKQDAAAPNDRAEALALADKHNFCIIALTEDSFGKLRLQAKAD